MMDVTQRTYQIVKQLYPTTEKPYFVVAMVLSGDRLWHTTMFPGFLTIRQALDKMSTLQFATARGNEVDD